MYGSWYTIEQQLNLKEIDSGSIRSLKEKPLFF